MCFAEPSDVKLALVLLGGSFRAWVLGGITFGGVFCGYPSPWNRWFDVGDCFLVQPESSYRWRCCVSCVSFVFLLSRDIWEGVIDLGVLWWGCFIIEVF